MTGRSDTEREAAGGQPDGIVLGRMDAGAQDVTVMAFQRVRAGKARIASQLHIYADAGIDGTKPVIVYYRIGERSSHTWFVLSKILGYDVKQYDGSWTEYGNAVGVPISNPSGTVWGAT